MLLSVHLQVFQREKNTYKKVQNYIHQLKHIWINHKLFLYFFRLILLMWVLSLTGFTVLTGFVNFFRHKVQRLFKNFPEILGIQIVQNIINYFNFLIFSSCSLFSISSSSELICSCFALAVILTLLDFAIINFNHPVLTYTRLFPAIFH